MKWFLYIFISFSLLLPVAAFAKAPSDIVQVGPNANFQLMRYSFSDHTSYTSASVPSKLDATFSRFSIQSYLASVGNLFNFNSGHLAQVDSCSGYMSSDMTWSGKYDDSYGFQMDAGHYRRISVGAGEFDETILSYANGGGYLIHQHNGVTVTIPTDGTISALQSHLVQRVGSASVTSLGSVHNFGCNTTYTINNERGQTYLVANGGDPSILYGAVIAVNVAPLKLNYPSYDGIQLQPSLACGTYSVNGNQTFLASGQSQGNCFVRINVGGHSRTDVTPSASAPYYQYSVAFAPGTVWHYVGTVPTLKGASGGQNQ